MSAGKLVKSFTRQGGAREEGAAFNKEHKRLYSFINNNEIPNTCSVSINNYKDVLTNH